MLEVEFDLKKVSDTLAARQSWLRIVFLSWGVVIIIAAGAGGLLVAKPSRTDLTLGFIGLLLGIFFFWFSSVWMSHPPVKLIVNQVGISYIYSSGAIKQFEWNDPRLSMTFTDKRYLRQTPAEVESEISAVAKVGGINRSDAVLNAEAYEYVLRESNRRGLVIRPETWEVVPTSESIVRIHAARKPMIPP